jgi:hypothetical protein
MRQVKWPIAAARRYFYPGESRFPMRGRRFHQLTNRRCISCVTFVIRLARRARPVNQPVLLVSRLVCSLWFVYRILIPFQGPFKHQSYTALLHVKHPTSIRRIPNCPYQRTTAHRRTTELRITYRAGSPDLVYDDLERAH